MQAGQVFPLTTVDGVQFTGAIVQHGSLQEDLSLPGPVGAGGVGRCRIRSAVLWSSQPLDWEIQIYTKHDATSADPNSDSFCGRVAWAAAVGLQNGGAGLYRYYSSDLDIPYEDADYEGSGMGPNPPGLAKIHILLVNRNAAAKVAYGAGGHVRVQLNIEPVHGG